MKIVDWAPLNVLKNLLKNMGYRLKHSIEGASGESQKASLETKGIHYRM